MQEDVRGQRLFVIITLTLLFLGSAGIGIFMLVWNPKPTGQLMEVQGTSGRVARAAAINAPAGWREKFDAVYKLAEGQIVKRIPPPWVPEREYFWKTEYGNMGTTDGPTYMQLMLINGRLENMGMSFGGKNYTRPVASVVQGVSSLRPYQFEIPASANDIDMGGDYIVREPSTQKQKLDELAKLINEASRKSYRFAEEKREREVIVATGTYSFKPKADAPEQTSVHLYADKYDPGGRDSGGGTTNLEGILSFVGQFGDTPILVETDVSQVGMLKFRIHQSAYNGNADSRMDQVLKNLSEQTGLKFEKVKREVPVWILRE